MGVLNKLTIQGFKSIKDVTDFELKDLNVVVGANGAGKSNFVDIFRMLKAMCQKNLSKFILERGGADNFLFNGPKVTDKINISFKFKDVSPLVNQYSCELTPTADEKFLIKEYRANGVGYSRSYGPPDFESKLYNERNDTFTACKTTFCGLGRFVYNAINNLMVYHFHDTSASAPMRRSEIIEDYQILRGNAANLAPFLLNLRNNHEPYYKEILNAVCMVIPFFDDFRLDVQSMGEAEKVRLSWTQKGSDYPMQPYHLSDGSIRFICLATALLQPYPPSTIIIDEPELGLHPAAIVILAELIQIASHKTQVIIATQSPALVDQFAIEDIIVVNRDEGASTFKRLKEEDFSEWLKSYSVGELWTKNVIIGGPVFE